MPTYITLVCPHCKREFELPKGWKRKFCSHECSKVASEAYRMVR